MRRPVAARHGAGRSGPGTLCADDAPILRRHARRIVRDPFRPAMAETAAETVAFGHSAARDIVGFRADLRIAGAVVPVATAPFTRRIRRTVS